MLLAVHQYVGTELAMCRWGTWSCHLEEVDTELQARNKVVQHLVYGSSAPAQLEEHLHPQRLHLDRPARSPLALTPAGHEQTAREQLWRPGAVAAARSSGAAEVFASPRQLGVVQFAGALKERLEGTGELREAAEALRVAVLEASQRLSNTGLATDSPASPAFDSLPAAYS